MPATTTYDLSSCSGCCATCCESMTLPETLYLSLDRPCAGVSETVTLTLVSSGGGDWNYEGTLGTPCGSCDKAYVTFRCYDGIDVVEIFVGLGPSGSCPNENSNGYFCGSAPDPLYFTGILINSSGASAITGCCDAFSVAGTYVLTE